MNVIRHRFIDQFGISIYVHALKLWSRRKEPPARVAGVTYETIALTKGIIEISRAEFSKIVQPIITELHKKLPRGERPTWQEYTGLVYDALSEAGVEVWIAPPTQAHGHMYGTKR